MRTPRLERDRQQWIFDYIVQETGKVFHWDEEARTLPKSVKSQSVCEEKNVLHRVKVAGGLRCHFCI